MPEEHTINNFLHVYGQPEINYGLLSVYACDNLSANHRILTELHQWFCIRYTIQPANQEPGLYSGSGVQLIMRSS